MYRGSTPGSASIHVTLPSKPAEGLLLGHEGRLGLQAEMHLPGFCVGEGFYVCKDDYMLSVFHRVYCADFICVRYPVVYAIAPPRMPRRPTFQR